MARIETHAKEKLPTFSFTATGASAGAPLMVAFAMDIRTGSPNYQRVLMKT